MLVVIVNLIASVTAVSSDSYKVNALNELLMNLGVGSIGSIENVF